jgi:hypothetical protein
MNEALVFYPHPSRKKKEDRPIWRVGFHDKNEGLGVHTHPKSIDGS